MWVKPGYQPEGSKRKTAPPRERGRRLAAIPRGHDEEIRISIETFEGHGYIALRIWRRGHGGGWWPVRGKGISVRAGEAKAVLNAVGIADAILNGGDHD